MALSPHKGEVILLVDDEAPIRRLLRSVLESMGYIVLDAGDGREGLDVCRDHEGQIDILVSDVNMPHLDGHELAASAREMRPGLRVLLMSGFSEEIVFDERAATGTAFLQKPFTSVDLRQKLSATRESHSYSVPA